MSDWLVSFLDHTCPACGKGTIVPIYKNLHQYKQNSSSDTIVGYHCDACDTRFKVKYTLNEETNTHEPHILYLDSEIEQFKTQFIQKGEKSHEKTNIDVRNSFQKTNLQKET